MSELTLGSSRSYATRENANRQIYNTLGDLAHKIDWVLAADAGAPNRYKVVFLLRPEQFCYTRMLVDKGWYVFG